MAKGMAAQMALGILEAFGLPDAGPDSPEALHAQIEAMKLAFADIYRYVAEPGSMPSERGRPLGSLSTSPSVRA